MSKFNLRRELKRRGFWFRDHKDVFDKGHKFINIINRAVNYYHALPESHPIGSRLIQIEYRIREDGFYLSIGFITPVGVTMPHTLKLGITIEADWLWFSLWDTTRPQDDQIIFPKWGEGGASEKNLRHAFEKLMWDEPIFHKGSLRRQVVAILKARYPQLVLMTPDNFILTKGDWRSNPKKDVVKWEAWVPVPDSTLSIHIMSWQSLSDIIEDRNVEPVSEDKYFLEI